MSGNLVSRLRELGGPVLPPAGLYADCLSEARRLHGESLTENGLRSVYGTYTVQEWIVFLTEGGRR